MKLSGALRASRQARQAERAGHGRRERSRASEWVWGFGQGVRAKRSGMVSVQFSVRANSAWTGIPDPTMPSREKHGRGFCHAVIQRFAS